MIVPCRTCSASNRKAAQVSGCYLASRWARASEGLGPSRQKGVVNCRICRICRICWHVLPKVWNGLNNSKHFHHFRKNDQNLSLLKKGWGTEETSWMLDDVGVCTRPGRGPKSSRRRWSRVGCLQLIELEIAWHSFDIRLIGLDWYFLWRVWEPFPAPRPLHSGACHAEPPCWGGDGFSSRKRFEGADTTGFIQFFLRK